MWFLWAHSLKTQSVLPICSTQCLWRTYFIIEYCNWDSSYLNTTNKKIIIIKMKKNYWDRRGKFKQKCNYHHLPTNSRQQYNDNSLGLIQTPVLSPPHPWFHTIKAVALPPYRVVCSWIFSHHSVTVLIAVLY